MYDSLTDDEEHLVKCNIVLSLRNTLDIYFTFVGNVSYIVGQKC